MRAFLGILLVFMVLAGPSALAKDTLRMLTWEGYVTQDDVSRINALLSQKGYDIEVVVIKPYAEGAEQMYSLIRKDEVDIAFLTLFFIKMHREKISNVIQTINVNSPRLDNYKYLLPGLGSLSMGMRGDQPLYIPFAGGSYGFYVNRKKVSAAEVPQSWKDLLAPRWQGKYSLNRAQIWYNVAIASMILGKAPYYLNSLAVNGQRERVIEETKDDSPLADTLTNLYRNAGNFWDSGTVFLPHLEIVSSWGPEIKQANRDGGDWRPINFKEGNLLWMDTINFVSSLVGKRLEAAEIVANYLIGKEVQSRVASDLSLVSVSRLATSNPILARNPDFFVSGAFVPPYDTVADNRMQQMSNRALKEIGLQLK